MRPSLDAVGLHEHTKLINDERGDIPPTGERHARRAKMAPTQPPHEGGACVGKRSARKDAGKRMGTRPLQREGAADGPGARNSQHALAQRPMHSRRSAPKETSLSPEGISGRRAPQTQVRFRSALGQHRLWEGWFTSGLLPRAIYRRLSFLDAFARLGRRLTHGPARHIWTLNVVLLRMWSPWLSSFWTLFVVSSRTLHETTVRIILLHVCVCL